MGVRKSKKKASKSKKKGNHYVSDVNVRKYLFKYGRNKLGVEYAKDIPKETIELIKFLLREEGKSVTVRNVKLLLCDKFVRERLNLKECRGRKKKVEYKPSIDENLLEERGYWNLMEYGERWIPACSDDIYFNTDELFGKGSKYLQGGNFYAYEDTFQELVDACNDFVNSFGEASSSHTILVMCDEDSLHFNHKKKRWEIKIKLYDELTGEDLRLGGIEGIREFTRSGIERSEEKEEEILESLREKERGKQKESEVVESEKEEREGEVERVKELELEIEREKSARVGKEIELANKQGILELTKLLGKGDISKSEYLELIKVFQS